MRRLFLLFVGLLLAFTALAQRGIRTQGDGHDSPMGEYHLLVIGIDDYVHWPKLKSAVGDARAVRDVLVRDYGFDASHIVELYNADATERSIKGAIRTLGKTLTSEDSLLIYYAGHGQLDDFTKEGAWIPVEGRLDNDSRWIACATIKSYLRNLPARHVLLISDSCFAGDFFRGGRGTPPEITNAYVREAFKKSSRQAITSGGLEPVVDDGFDNHSVFAYFLLKELQENKSPFLLPSDLHNRIKGGVSENANQTPILGTLQGTGGEVGGEFVLFRKGAGGSMEALLQRKAERLERLEAMEQESRKAAAAAHKLEAEKQAELNALDQRIKSLEAKVGTGDAGGGTLKELVALVEQQEQQAEALEELKRKKSEEEAARRAEIARLKQQEAEKRKLAFDADYADYQKIVLSKYARKAIKQQAWVAICKAWAISDPPAAPGALRWDTVQDCAELTDVGELLVSSSKPGKIKLGTGTWNALEPGRNLRWASLPVGTYTLEAEIGGKPWQKSVTIRDDETTIVTVSLGAAPGADYAFELGGGSKLEMVWVKALNMWVGKYEVTNEQYRRIVQGHDSKEYKGHSLNEDHQPVVYVNFDDAKTYAEKLTRQLKTGGGIPDGYRFRLPSEKEWMTFSQCGDGREYPWGNNWPPRSGQAGNYDDETTFDKGSVEGGYRDGNSVACDVEKSWANPWGLYGVGGNVWECCAEDNVGGSFGAWRGASWDNFSQDILRCSFRFVFYVVGSYRVYSVGFRLVLSR